MFPLRTTFLALECSVISNQEFAIYACPDSKALYKGFLPTLLITRLVRALRGMSQVLLLYTEDSLDGDRFRKALCISPRLECKSVFYIGMGRRSACSRG